MIKNGGNLTTTTLSLSNAFVSVVDGSHHVTDIKILYIPSIGTFSRSSDTRIGVLLLTEALYDPMALGKVIRAIKPPLCVA